MVIVMKIPSKSNATLEPVETIITKIKVFPTELTTMRVKGWRRRPRREQDEESLL
jgi:hypothetical protein